MPVIDLRCICVSCRRL